MKNLLTLKALLATSALSFVACSPVAKNSQIAVKDNGSVINGTEIPAEDQIAKVTVAIVSITRNAKGEEAQSKCTGILFSKNVVLTAAHCVPVVPEGGKRAAFIVFNTNIDAAKAGDVRRVTRFAIHSKYNPESKEKSGNADFGMLKFEGQMPAGYEVGTFTHSDTSFQLSKETPVIVAGYGRIDDATEVHNNKLRRGEVKILGLINDTEVAFDQKNRNGVCSGDSGGPAFIEVQGKMIAWAIASRVSGPDKSSYCSGIGVHGMIDAQQDFINETMTQFEEPEQLSFDF